MEHCQDCFQLIKIMGLETTAQPVAFTSFRGLNTSLSDISIQSREATSLENVNLFKETVQVRSGNALFSKTQMIEAGVAKAITGIYQTVLGTTVRQVITAGTKINSISGNGVLTDITGAVVLTDSQNNLFRFAKAKDSGGANDIIVACNGVDAPIKWTGAGNAAVLGGSPPANFKLVLWRKNRLYGTDGEFIYHSDLLDAESWDPLNWVLKLSSSGIYVNDITGIIEYGDNIAIFKEDRIYLFSGENFTEGYIQEVVTGDGCISGYSPVEVLSRRHGNIIVFVNRNRELKGFNGTKNLIAISAPIDISLQIYSQNRAKYISAINYKKFNQYYATITREGTGHNRIVAYDYFLDGFQQGDDPESTMLLHSNITANALAIMDSLGRETLFTGTYDGWVLKHDEIYERDVIKASQIQAPNAGAVRVANVVTITTLVDHGFSVGDEVIISGVDDSDFNGTFTIDTVPNTDEFTYVQADVDAVSGNGIARLEADIAAHWQSKKNSFGNAAFQKQLNDFNIVTANVDSGQIKTTIVTDSGSGEAINDISANGYFYGDEAFYGEAEYGATGTSYNQSNFTMDNSAALLAGRYFIVKFENIDGFRFSLEEYIMGITSQGYQQEYRP